ncbi:hypothetical protein HS041_25360 [Planomonospora sp. ID67723]|uniref:hypothetical protein n=1 Tax=Planomonospora sp. ID67723 TaxID=2738134 RepID=UPI0018C3727D|nr:hypothetical protein [Planomonospora sp. ID67723]MBG0831093.1 hypothetical protein [Planomonospora sp. ID67723]
MVTAFVVVHDGSCGGCSAIAARLDGLLAVPVIVRSCRDPRLTTEFPVLYGERPCRRPLAVLQEDGRTRVVGGVRLLLRGALLVAPGRRGRALRLGAWIVWTRLRHLITGTSAPVSR